MTVGQFCQSGRINNFHAQDDEDFDRRLGISEDRVWFRVLHFVRALRKPVRLSRRKPEMVLRPVGSDLHGGLKYSPYEKHFAEISNAALDKRANGLTRKTFLFQY